MGEDQNGGALKVGVGSRPTANGSAMGPAGTRSPKLADGVGTSARLEAKIKALAGKLQHIKVTPHCPASPLCLRCPCMMHADASLCLLVSRCAAA